MKELFDILSAGGWGVATIFAFVIWRLYKDNKELNAENREEGKIVTTALVETRSAVQAFKEYIEKLEAKREQEE